MPKPKNKPPKQTMAARADKHKLYEISVQMPEHEVDFFLQAYAETRGGEPWTLGEDFCGTFAVSCQWVRSNKKRTAIGYDNCGETLQWGRDNNLSRLSKEQQNRVTLYQQDVRERSGPKLDVLAAQNFSFWFFKTRKEVLQYFTVALSNLADDGIMVIDMMGGAECRTEGLIHTQTIQEGKEGFKYQWKQVSYNPITSDACCSISFIFADGSRLNDAFVYRWRLWTIVEVREILAEVGFRDTHVYWAVDGDLDFDRDGGWQRREKAPSDASWTCYLVALK
tara:strand:+ start:30774 stop:31613 length:840 start_codon:yes stop_codon:yes gene_type:complete